MTETMMLRRLDWDSDFFGLKIAEATGLADPRLDFPLIRPRMQEASVTLCYVSLPQPHADVAGLAAESGGRRINSRITLHREMDVAAEDCPGCDILGIPTDVDRADLNDLAIVAGKYSRFHMDKKFPADGFARLYERWMTNSIAGVLADMIAVFRIDGRIRGMVTLQKKDAKGVIGLIAVADGYRGKSIGKSLMAAATQWFSSNSCLFAEVVTQGENIPALNLYARAGFQVVADDDIYHFWDD